MWLIISKNIDSFNNPTILSLLKLLEERNIKVLFFQKKSIFKYNSLNVRHLYFNENYICFPKKYNDVIKFIKNIYSILLLKLYARKITRVIGIDPPGLIWADKLNKTVVKCKRLDYFSFEIDTRSETETKKIEIEICNRIKNIVIQDQYREELFRKINKIENNITFHHIPVSFSRIAFNLYPSDNPSSNFRKKHNLNNKVRLVLFMGTFEKWAGSDYIVKILEENILPDDVIMVIHSRFKLDERNKIMKFKNNKNLIIDNQYIDDTNDLIDFVRQFDLGLAMYIPDYSHYLLGDNLNYIGLSSGKFSLYMLCQLPTISTDQLIFKKLIGRYDYGYCINDYEEFKNAILDSHVTKAKSNSCNKLFDEILEPTGALQKYINS